MGQGLKKGYLLAAHAHLCQTERGAIVLDLRHDRYLGIEADACGYLSGRVEGWPVPPGWPSQPERSAEWYAQLLEELMTVGILTSDPRTGRRAIPSCVTQPVSALIAGYTPASARMGFRNTLRFSIAAARAKTQLRRLSMEQLINLMRDRATGNHLGAFDVNTAQAHVAAFIRMRTWLFSARNACLFDSLCLRHYLTAHGLPSVWVFGVKPYPFAAHCWLQHGGIVLNDTPEHVRNFTPIMAV